MCARHSGNTRALVRVTSTPYLSPAEVYATSVNHGRAPKNLNDLMKQFPLIVVALLTAPLLLGQTRDTRAILDITGRVNEISVSPQGRIWLVTAMGSSYFSDDIDATWNQHPQFVSSRENYELRSGSFDRISFFNSDTAIMTGYIGLDENDGMKNGLFRTTDAGRTWEPINHGGNLWVYDAFASRSGKAWIGGSSGDLLFSEDYGRTWRKLASPYDESTRLHSIFMLDGGVGVIGALHNNIDMTSNNWKTRRRIQTPMDQKKYKRLKSYSDDRIEKVLLWKDLIVANQNGHIFYTEQVAINWKAFPVKLIDVELDIAEQVLYGVTDDLRVVSFATLTEYTFLPDQGLPQPPVDISIAGHALYAVLPGYQVAKVDALGMTCVTPYTIAHPIPEPEIVRESGPLTWGATGDQLYLREAGSGWYREASLTFGVADMKLLDDSTAILWDGRCANYRYSLLDHEPSHYTLPDPLSGFLSSPIVSLTINSGTQGCFHHVEETVHYRRTPAQLLGATGYTVSRYGDDTLRSFSHTIDDTQLTSILRSISQDPEAIPSQVALTITEQDVSDYKTLVQERKEGNVDDLIHPREMDMDLYTSLPGRLDTLSPAVIERVLWQVESGRSTTSNWFIVELSSEAGDTLHFTSQYYTVQRPWGLPWQVHTGGLHFSTCSVELSKLIATALPEGFFGADMFSNARLLLAIADYFNDLKQVD